MAFLTGHNRFLHTSLVRHRGAKPDRIVWIDGGYLLSPGTELWPGFLGHWLVQWSLALVAKNLILNISSARASAPEGKLEFLYSNERKNHGASLWPS